EKLSLYCQRAGVRSIWPAKILEHHTSSVSAVCLSGDGRYAFSGSHAGKFGPGGGTLRLWDVYEGRCLKEFRYGETVCCVGMSANGDWGVSGGANGEIVLWDLRKGRYERSFSGHTCAVTGVAISGDGRYVLSCGEDRTLRLWDADSGNWLRVTGGGLDRLYSLCLSPTARYVVSGEGNGLVRLWELASGRCPLTIKGHSPSGGKWGLAVLAVCVSSDERYALSASADQTLRLWELETGECVRVFSGHAGAVTSVCFSSDGGYALSGSADKTLRLWEVETGRCLHVLEGHAGPVTSVALSPNARYALSASGDGTLRLWEIDWELKAREPADWDEGARPLLEAFLLGHASAKAEMVVHRNPSPGEIKRALTRNGTPAWGEQDFQSLIRQLQYAGYGWLRPEGVESKLKEMADAWRQTPQLAEKRPRPPGNLQFYLSSRFHHYKRALRPYTTLFIIGGLVAAMVLLYNALSSVGPGSYRDPYGSYSVYDGPGAASPRERIIPHAALLWRTYEPGNHGLSIELSSAPVLVDDTIPDGAPPIVKVNEQFVSPVREYFLATMMVRIVFVKSVKVTPKIMLPTLENSIAAFGRVTPGYQARPREAGGLLVSGSLETDSGEMRLFHALVLARGSEAWLIITLRRDDFGGDDAKAAAERIVNSARF
ncbi:MAG TPA: WD40 repeat domain-containing protein, partial [Pyrinomonadaceae bacterium]|nr:WD40 repeat domain-containing protein [Pyrinomonadaceae bacterium]